MKDDPEFTSRDGVYFYLAESLIKVKRKAEALPLLREAGGGIRAERISATTQKRIAEFKAVDRPVGPSARRDVRTAEPNLRPSRVRSRRYRG